MESKSLEKPPSKQAAHNVLTTDDEYIGTIENVDGLSRKLTWRQMQLMIIGGSIGTALFVTIGAGLISAGPAGLLIGFIIYASCLAAVNNCMAEMSTYMPVSGGWIRMASHWVDDALGFALGWNFFLYEALLIPYEISALNLVLTFWSDRIPAAAICVGCIVIYGLINVFAVNRYGESEFWLSIGKVILIFVVFGFTIVSMCGGNPQHDAYGFRYWNNPGAFVAYLHQGSLGRFEGVLAGLWRACFTIVGPEYVSMLAAEAKYPRKNLKRAFRTIYWRFGFFFIGSAIAIGIGLPSNDATLVAVNSGAASGAGTGGASPYVIAMENMGIGVLPHIVNALLMTSIFSAGNSYVYCGTRSLYSLSLDGHAPKFLQKCLKSGIPIYCFAVTMVFPFLSLLILGSSSSAVVLWLADLVTGGQLINFIGMSLVYIFFYRATKAQGFSRDNLPYKGPFQPYSAWIGLISITLTVFCYGYAIFLPGSFTVGNFFIYYCMLLFVVVAYIGWKLVKRTRIIPALEVDLIWDAPKIDAYEASLESEDESSMWDEIRKIIGLGKKEESSA